MCSRIATAFCVLLALVLTAARAGEPPANTVATDILVKLQAALEAERVKVDAEHKKDLDAFTAEHEGEFKKATEARTFQVDVGGQQKEITEYRKRDDVTIPEFDPVKAWSLRTEDFRFDLPVEVYIERMVSGNRLATKDEMYLVLPFSLTNTLIEVAERGAPTDKNAAGEYLGTMVVNSQEEVAALEAKAGLDKHSVKAVPAKAGLSPRFTMVTDGGVFTSEMSGFLVHEAVELSTFSDRAWSKDLIAFERDEAPQQVGFFEPGETKLGVAIFPRFDPGTNQVRILIEGLTNEYNFKTDMRKALILEFVRPGNIYYPGQKQLAFKRRLGEKLMDPKTNYVPDRDDDAHHGFDWTWLWTWESAAEFTQKPQATEMDSPLGADKQRFWTYTLRVPNRTGLDQTLGVEKVVTVIKMDLLGVKDIEVPFVDDGKMNVYKAAFFEQQGMTVQGERFPKGLRLEKALPEGEAEEAPEGAEGESAEFTVCFRETDYDLEAVLRNLHRARDLELATKRNAKGARDKEIFLGVNQMGAEDVAKLEAELKEKIPAALAAQLQKEVVAEVSAKSGLASGTRLVKRSMEDLGKVE